MNDAGTISYGGPKIVGNLGYTSYGTNAGSVLQPAGGTYYQGGQSPQKTASVSTFQPAASVQVTGNPMNYLSTLSGQPSASFGGANIANDLANFMSSLEAKYNELLKPVYAPKYDIAGNRAKAYSQSESQTNPYYAKRLDQILRQDSLERQQMQTKTAMDIRDIEDTLRQTQEGNQIQRGRTAEDTQLANELTNTKQEQMQEDTAAQFEDVRMQQARDLFVRGMTGSGVGARETSKAQEGRNTTEQRAVQEFDRTRAAQDLFQRRTFQDLGRSDEIASLTATKGKEKANFNLSSFIANQDLLKEVNTLVLENERQQAVANNADKIYKTALNNWITTLGPREQVAARAAYGG